MSDERAHFMLIGADSLNEVLNGFIENFGNPCEALKDEKKVHDSFHLLEDAVGYARTVAVMLNKGLMKFESDEKFNAFVDTFKGFADEHVLILNDFALRHLGGSVRN